LVDIFSCFILNSDVQDVLFPSNLFFSPRILSNGNGRFEFTTVGLCRLFKPNTVACACMRERNVQRARAPPHKIPNHQQQKQKRQHQHLPASPHRSPVPFHHHAAHRFSARSLLLAAAAATASPVCTCSPRSPRITPSRMILSRKVHRRRRLAHAVAPPPPPRIVAGHSKLQLPLAPAAGHCHLPLASAAGAVVSSRCTPSPPSAPSSSPRPPRRGPLHGCWPSSTPAASIARSEPPGAIASDRLQSPAPPAPTDLISRCHSPPPSSQLDDVRGYRRTMFRPRPLLGRMQTTWFLLNSEYHFVWTPFNSRSFSTLTSSSAMLAVPSTQNADAGRALAAVACSRAFPVCAST
jgi:hypothetical protein